MKKLILPLLISLLLCAQAYPAEKALVIGTGGYQGGLQAGIKYGYFTFLYGYNEDSGDQLSLRFDYNFLKYLTVGAFATYSLDSDTFWDTPSKYPDDGYYRQTKIRSGLSLGLRYNMFYVATNILDNSLDLIISDDYYNKKSRMFDSKFWSTSAGIIIEF